MVEKSAREVRVLVPRPFHAACRRLRRRRSRARRRPGEMPITTRAAAARTAISAVLENDDTVAHILQFIPCYEPLHQDSRRYVKLNATAAVCRALQTACRRLRDTELALSIRALCHAPVPRVQLVRTYIVPSDDDYYTSRMDWSSNSMLAMVPGVEDEKSRYVFFTRMTPPFPEVFAYDSNTNPWHAFSLEQHSKIRALAFIADGNLLATGDKGGSSWLHDIERCQLSSSCWQLPTPVCSLAWCDSLLTAGTATNDLFFHDIRSPPRESAKLTPDGIPERTRIVGLRWSPDLTQLAAADAHAVRVWDKRMLVPQPLFELLGHGRSTGRALSWAPWQRHLLASGGGRGDGTIQLWDTSSGRRAALFDAEAQVTTLCWDQLDRALFCGFGLLPSEATAISSRSRMWLQRLTLSDGVPEGDASMRYSLAHSSELRGDASHFVWRSMQYLDEEDQLASPQSTARYPAHTRRVLEMKLSPSGKAMATASGEGVLNLWKLYDGEQ